VCSLSGKAAHPFWVGRFLKKELFIQHKIQNHGIKKEIKNPNHQTPVGEI
jgi:hypothetical protein